MIRLRNEAISLIRSYLLELSLNEVYTGSLSRISGIEPFLNPPHVYFPTLERQGWYLRTSPEFALKKLLVLYYQASKGIFEITSAFRDEPTSNYHALEFTMLEWYEKDFNYLDLADRIVALIKKLLQQLEYHREPTEIINLSDVNILSVQDLFSIVFSFSLDANTSFDEYAILAKQNKVFLSTSLDVHSDGAEEWYKIAYFDLLFENCIIPYLRSKDICFVYDFPYFLQGMSCINTQGWSQRIECYVKGIEIANGYQELYDSQELTTLLAYNNFIRHIDRQAPHRIDDMLLHVISDLEGYAGMALGIERLLMGMYGIPDIKNFFIG